QLWAAQLEPARRELGPSRVAAVEAAGRALTLEQAVDEALCWLSAPRGDEYAESQPMHEAAHAPVPPSPSLPVPTVPLGPAGVTRREQEVVALVARGLSNRQIAAELTITEGTAASHVKHILARLGLDSRVQIATWAIEHGLHGASSSRLDAAS